MTSIYGSPEQFKEQIHALHCLRQDVRGCADDPTGRDIVYRYYGQLDLLELRIPVHEHGCRVLFEWTDTYSSENMSQYSLAFEKASVLFNLASIYSHIARDADDIKVAYASLQASAGIFQFIVENFLHAPSKDLQQETGRALAKLMLAQAQEVFLTKQLQDSEAKPLLLAKLSKGASTMYKDSSEALQAVYDSKQWGPASWPKYCTAKSKYYEAVAADYYAKSLELKGKYGEALAYLQASLSGLKEAIKSLSLLSLFQGTTIEGTGNTSGVLETQTLFKNYSEAVKHKFDTLEKDNDFIYHSTVPNASTLAPIPALEASKPTSMNGLYKENENISKIIGKDLFSNIVPVSVHEKASLYSEEKANLIRHVGESVDIADEELTSALEHLNLPEMLNVVKNQKKGLEKIEVPDQVLRWNDEVSKSEPISTSLSNLDSIRGDVLKIISDAEGLVSDETRAWSDAKARYGPRWVQVAPERYAADILDETRAIKDLLLSGKVSDEKLASLSSQFKPEIDTLRNKDQLGALFSVKPTSSQPESLLDIDDTSESAIDSGILNVESVLNKLRKLSKERRMAFSEFKGKVHNDDITGLLVLNAKVSNIEKTLFPSELAKFDPYKTRIDDASRRQEELLNVLKDSWKSLLSNRAIQDRVSQTSALNEKRSKETEKLGAAYSAFKTCTDGFSKGMSFYLSLRDRANESANKATQFVNQRRSDREVLMRQLDQSPVSQEDLRLQLSGLSMGQQNNQYGYPANGSDSYGQRPYQPETRDYYSPPALPPKR